MPVRFSDTKSSIEEVKVFNIITPIYLPEYQNYGELQLHWSGHKSKFSISFTYIIWNKRKNCVWLV